ncbi:MAG TPA: hypothetical protein PLE82_02030, partial [Saccharofermentans sp.]|nr:hypothetical protein [Saccharofermentans sp.]
VAPVQQRTAPGFLFGDDSVNAPVSAKRPVSEPVSDVDTGNISVQPVQQPQQARQPSAPVQQPIPPYQGGRPTTNVSPAPAPEEHPQKTAKPWFMFGKDGE